MKDADGDDWGDEAPPVGVDAGTDCNDADSVIHPETTWYADTDGFHGAQQVWNLFDQANDVDVP